MRNLGLVKPILYLLLLFFLYSFKIPDFYSSFHDPIAEGQNLDYIVIEINGERKILKKGQSLTFIKGDKIKLVSSHLKNSSETVEETNVVGFRNPIDRRLRNDLGFEIDSNTNLHNNQWAVNESGDLYVIVASSKKTLHGISYLKRIVPRLKYVDIQVNDKTRVVRDGELLRVSPSDEFKVERFVTNLKNNEEVTFQIVSMKTKRNVLQKKDVKKYQMVFKHRTHKFGNISIWVMK